MRYGQEHKTETRRRVLREAAREIRAKGPDGVGVAGIMARAGLTHGGFYAHFGSKDDLVAEAVGAMFDDARGRLAATDHDGDPREMLRAYVDAYLSIAHRDNRDRGCPLPALSGDLARGGTAVRRRFGAGVAALTERLSAWLQAIGHEAAGADASAMLAQMVGAVSLARAVDDLAQSDAILADARADLISRYGLEIAR